VVDEDLQSIWVRGLPFKISFLNWRIWLGKIPVATIINTWNPQISQDCGCCQVPKRETIEHLFLKGDVANKVWSHYCTVAGLIDNRLNLKQSIRLWRDMEGNSRSKTVFHIVPFVVIWGIWKRRNIVLYGGQYRIGKIFWEIDTILGRFMKVRWKMETLGKKWSELVDLLHGNIVEYFSKVVRWFPPPIRWLKCNTDGASKGNPGLSSVAFCIRDHTGDLVVAIGKRI